MCYSQYCENSLFQKSNPCSAITKESELQSFNQKDKLALDSNSLPAHITSNINQNLSLFPKSEFEYCSRLANYYDHSGQFGESENYFQKAVAVYKSFPGINPTEYAIVLGNFANLYKKTGRFDLAEEYYNESSHVFNSLGLGSDIQHSNILLNQAIMHTALGQNFKAEQLLLLAKTNMECNDQTKHNSYLQILENLGRIYRNQLLLDKAFDIYQKAIQIHETTHKLDSMNYAECINSMGTIRLLKGELEIAESLFQKAICIANPKEHSGIHPNYYNDLAKLYLQTKQFEKAEKLFLQVKQIYENHFGKLNRSYLSLLENLAQLYQNMQNPAQATKYLIEASKLRKRIIYDSFKYLNGNETEEFLQSFHNGIAGFNNFLIHCEVASDTLLKEAFENELFYKGFQLNYHIELNKIILENPKLNSLNDSIKRVYQLISMECTNSPLTNSLADSLRKIALQLELRLGQKATGYNELIKLIHYNDINEKLKPHEAIIEMMYLNIVSESMRDSIVYAAMIVRSDSLSPSLVYLCTEEELQKLFINSSKLNADYVSTLYNMNSRGIKPLEENSNGLHELIWKKLDSHLTGIHTIYYTPAGLLNKINFQAIPVSETMVAGELYDIVQFTSSRQLLKASNAKIQFQSALIMGGIQYDKSQTTTHGGEENKFASRGIITPSNRSNDNFWPALHYTLREIHHVAEIFTNNKITTKKYSGQDATEEIFKNETHSGSSPGIIHIATHGYYFNDKDDHSNDTTTNCPFMKSSNPMMRSGLVLANGNYGWKHSMPMPGEKEDGILTALEISQMHLDQTQLAVLSACETGLGEIRGNEGVYGLQRAFKIAGVQYLIMSLWEIPDYQTEELMSQFYINFLNHKMDLPKAFQSAQMEMKHKYNNPYFWAGFILVQ